MSETATSGGARRARKAGRLLAAVLAALPLPAAAAPPRYRAAVDVTLATRQVRVLDENQCVARQVSSGDLQILASGQALATRVRRRPVEAIRVLVVVDASFSMVGKRLELAERAGRRLLERLAGERRGHEAAVALFDEGVYWLTSEGFTSDLCSAAEQLGNGEAGGGTALWAALSSALEVAAESPSPRTTAVVVVTDGQDTSDHSGELAARVSKRAVELGVPLFAIAIPPRSEVMLVDEGIASVSEVACSRAEWQPRGLDRERERLYRACMTSGGAMYTPRKARVYEAVDFVLTQIRDVHDVEAVIPPELAGADCRVEVSATRPGFRVLTEHDGARRR